MKNRSNFFDMLPDEMLDQITVYLPYNRSLANLSETSKRWNAIVAHTSSGKLAKKMQHLYPSYPRECLAKFYYPLYTDSKVDGVFAGVLTGVCTATMLRAIPMVNMINPLSSNVCDVAVVGAILGGSVGFIAQMSLFSTTQKVYMTEIHNPRKTIKEKLSQPYAAPKKL